MVSIEVLPHEFALTQNTKDFKVSVIIPSFNEQNNIRVLADKLVEMLSKYNDYEIIFIDDGSTDKTLENIQKLSEQNKKIKYISFSRNFGQQKALKAGLDHATGDCAISMDADLQHPPELIDQLIEKWNEGYEIVYTIREETRNLSLFKRKTASIFYKLMSAISDLDMQKGVADFRLMDKSVVEVFKDINEFHLFVRGMVSWIGFKECSIRYVPNDRFSGKSKYSFRKMFLFARDGLTSFSVKPLHLTTFLGIVISLLAFVYGSYAILARFIIGKELSGWASLLVSILFLGGIQLLVLGILGEYLGKLFVESKKRPNYIIRKKKL